MGREIVKGSVDQTVYFKLRQTSDGLAITGLEHDSGGAVCSYTRNRAVAVPITLAALVDPDSAHSDGGFQEVHATNAKGLYRLDLPDAAVASGVDSVIIHIAFTDVYSADIEISLIDNTKKQIYDIVAHGTYGNALLARTAAFPANFSDLSIVVSSGLVNITQAAADKVWATTVRALSTAGIKAIWDQLTSALTTVGSIGKKFADLGLGSDSKVLLSSDAHTGAVIPTVTTCTTTTTNTDMRGTNSSALASVCTEGRLAELDAANLPATTDNIETKVDTLTTNLATHDGKLDAAQLDLDTITGLDGVTLATAQGNYAPALAGDEMALSAQGKLDVNAEVVDVMSVDTMSELPQAQPSATPTIHEALMLWYMKFRNEYTQTSTVASIKNNAGTVIAKATVSDDSTTYKKQKLVAGT